MINPDGVVFGNSRTGAAGKDFNRCFKTKNKNFLPEIVNLKKLVQNMESNEIMFYLDIHGHSKRKNMFLYGPNYHIGEPIYYKCRILPKILSTLTPIFRYHGCNYDIPIQKKYTARAVMLNSMCIPYVYTLQCSLGLYNDQTSSKIKSFTLQKWQQLGQIILKGFIIYFEGYNQFEEFNSLKTKSKKFLTDNSQKPIKNPRQITFLKIFEQIKQLQEKKTSQQQRNKCKQQDENSDDYNDEEDMQIQKQRQFSQIIVQSMNQQLKKKIFLEGKKEERSQEDRKRFRIMMKRNRERLNREDRQGQDVEDSANRNNVKKKKHSVDIIQQKQSQFTPQLRSSKQIKFHFSLKQEKPSIQLSKSYKYIIQRKNINTAEPGLIKMNVNLFNFSKVVTNSIDSLNKDRHLLNAIQRQKKTSSNKFIRFDMKKFSDKINNNKSLIKQGDLKDQKRVCLSKLNIPVDNTDEVINSEQLQDRIKETMQDVDVIDQSNVVKRQIFIPSSLYKMKYQNHKKKLERKIKYKTNDHSLLQEQNSLNFIDSRLLNRDYNSLENRQGSFIKINKFPFL